MRSFASVLFAALIVTTGAVRSSGQQPDTSVKGLVKAAAAYVADFQAKLLYVIADEQYEQKTFDITGYETRHRVMNGELFLTYVSANHEWMAVHDIAAVDGDPVPDREDVKTLLTRGPLDSVFRTVTEQNSRFNIGDLTRNFNEPTLCLLVLESKRLDSFSFERKDLTKTADATVATLRFSERDRATLIRSERGGQPVFSKGEIDVEVGTGRVLRTRLELKIAAVSAVLSTTYSRDPKIEMWVPSTFTEHYEIKKGGGTERIECIATYTNYKKFGATGRIKGPGGRWRNW